MKIAILIPTTTKNTKFKKLEDTHLYRLCLPSLTATLSVEHKYTIYYAIDDDDKIYNKCKTKSKLSNDKLYKNIDKIKIISTNGIDKGDVVSMWNRLFRIAHDEGHDYFFQCGDDIEFYNNDWVNACIKTLSSQLNIGVVAPLDINNTCILTQSFVSRKHMDIFNNYFNPSITNWGCDDWITGVYAPQFTSQLPNHTLCNKGGQPRYNPDDDRELWDQLIKQDKLKLKDYITSTYFS